MAALLPKKIFADGQLHRITLYSVAGVNNLDSVDLSANYAKINGSFAAEVTSFLAAFSVATSTVGNTISFLSASLANDGIYLLVTGSGVNQ